MTAVEYLSKRNKFSALETRLGLSLATAAMIVVTIVYPRLVPVEQQNANLFSFWISIPAAILFFGTMLVFSRQRKKLVRSHPEMEHLGEWVEIVGSADKYPVTVDDKIRFAAEAARRIRVAASCTDLGYALRDYLFAAQEEYHILSAERALLKKMYQQIISVAVDEDTRYIEMWRLFVDDLRILEGSPYEEGPEFYRQKGLVKS